MKILRSPNDMRVWSTAQRCAGKTIGLVPTMGALHEGHLSLARACAAQNEASVMSIFVNPAQFAPHEDFDKYPRVFDSDCEKARSAGIDAVYAPDAATMYPDGYATYIEVERVKEGLCGASRPHFFRGVATVVAKLFNAVQPDRAYFGEKDAQQVAVIKRMVRDLDFGIEIVALPIVRESDGLAMSSRNAYLNDEEREKARCLSRALFEARSMIECGEENAASIVASVKRGIADLDIDYVEMVDADEMATLDRVEGKVLLAVAANVGNTRLIDNIIYEVPEP